MSKKLYYEKQGRKYVPVYEYDSQFLDSFPKGSHLVVCYPGGQSRRFNIDPAYAPMIAAGRIAEDAISNAIRDASDLRAQNPKTPLTEEQLECWQALAKSFGKEKHALEWPSAREAAESAVEAMQKEAVKLLTNPSVKQAYEHFLLVCELSKETK